ncbi:MAG: hypothetical protein Q9191_003562 [Dirinaria sp. TL-2023a]
METKLPYKWPLALDILKRQYDALPSQRLLAFQTQYIEKMPNMELALFGAKGYLVTDPRNVESLLSTRFEGEFVCSKDLGFACAESFFACRVDWGMGSRSDGLRPLLGEGIFTQDGAAWRHSRDMLRRQFIRINLRDPNIFEEHVNEMLATLSSAKGIVDLQPVFFRFTLATTTALIFGKPVSDLGDEDHNNFGKSFDYASLISALRLRLADLCWVYKPKKYVQACDVVHEYANYFVQEALRSKNHNSEGSLSESHALILDLYDELKDPLLVRDQLMHVLIAGRDTTACLMSWTLYLLVRHPMVLDKLRQEIQDVLQDADQISRSHIQQMTYLRSRILIYTALRLYPQLPVNVRVAMKTTLLPKGGGSDGESPVLMRRGTGVAYSVYHMHRRKDIYGPNADDFCPERWQEGKLDHVGWGFMPFHGGPRLCLGIEDFALLEASYGLIRILQTFPNLRLPPGEPVEPTGQEKQSLTIVVSSAEGCRVLLD